MKYVLQAALIAAQVWLASPLCCCWIKADEPSTLREAACCAAVLKTSPLNDTSSDQNHDCRCSEKKLEIVYQSPSPPSGARQDVLLVANLAPAIDAAALTNGDGLPAWHIYESPPLRSGPDRLYELHQLNL